MPSESKFVIKLVSIFGKQTHIITSGDFTGLALLFDVMLSIYIYVYLLWREMSGRTPTRPQGRALRRLDLRFVAVSPWLHTTRQIKNSLLRHTIRQNVRVMKVFCFFTGCLVTSPSRLSSILPCGIRSHNSAFTL